MERLLLFNVTNLFYVKLNARIIKAGVEILQTMAGISSDFDIELILGLCTY